MAKKRVCVLFGGSSADHSASLTTAYSVLNAIPKDKYEPLPIGITRAGRWLFYPGSYENIPDGSWERDSDCCSCILSSDALHKGVIKIMPGGESSIHRVDAIFPLLHGKYGEDGRIQGLCKLSGIPMIGNDLASSNACLDKKLTYMLLREAGLKTAEYISLERSAMNELEASLDNIEAKLGYPVYVTPANCSTSIGACRAENREELENAVKTAFSHHPTIIAEQELKGRQLECAILSGGFKNDRTAVGELIPQHKKADKLSDHIAETYTFEVPARLDGVTQSKIKDAARAAFRALSCKGFARIDMMLCDNDIIIRRVRGLPGLEKNSIFSSILTESGISYEEMLDHLISSTIDAR
ncbi:MAG: D-alanine--D-alanine ligase [Eubacterium sp.]|nr:D-alanine--D-alanine ligase [Eubacterium sp.]